MELAGCSPSPCHPWGQQDARHPLATFGAGRMLAVPSPPLGPPVPPHGVIRARLSPVTTPSIVPHSPHPSLLLARR